MTRTVCTEPGCPELSNGGRCADCRTKARRENDQQRPHATERGYDFKWRRTRGAYIHHHPRCEDPDGCDQPSVEVHHLDGLGPLGPQGHKWSNLQALCKKHHSQRTKQDQPAGTAAWRAPSAPPTVDQVSAAVDALSDPS